MLKVLTKGCEPTRGSKYSAAVDLYASEDCIIAAGETKIIGLGVAIDEEKIECIIEGFPKKEWEFELSAKDYERSIRDLEHFKNTHYLQVMLRSSLGKKGLILPNGVGVIDLDYKDEIKMIIHNPVTLDNCDFSSQNVCLNLSARITEASVGEYRRAVDESMKKHEGHFCKEIKKGDKIAQITLIEHKVHLFGINTNEERTGGFGSTGK